MRRSGETLLSRVPSEKLQHDPGALVAFNSKISVKRRVGATLGLVDDRFNPSGLEFGC